MEEVHQLLVRLLDGKHKTVTFTSPSISIQSLKSRIHQFTCVPTHHQLLTLDGRLLHDHQTLALDGAQGRFPTVVHLILRLRGGKGGFGSLLRGAATKAGQKKTNNFDACRDMSGRRLRHVNAEKKLEEWRVEAEERKLEKIAEEFIKKKAKSVKKDGPSGDAEKYVNKYREDSARCMEVVEKSVRESIKGFVSSKRKIGEVNESEAKRLKIWFGKRKLADSDIDDMDEDNSDDDDDDEEEEEEEENEKSTVINKVNCSDSSKEVEGSSDSVTGGKMDGESSVGGLSESSSEIEETAVKGILDGDSVRDEANVADESSMEICEGVSCVETAVVSGDEPVQAERTETNKTVSGNAVEIAPPSISGLGKVESSVSGATDADANDNSGSSPLVLEGPVVVTIDVSGKRLNFDEFSAAAEMEVLGMERLKSELQGRGLKCGGTLQERAARLFLLKTTPLEMLPKKLLAKK